MAHPLGRPGPVWRFPASGFAATAVLAVAPGSPMRPGDWPSQGPFGAYTWVAWYVSTSLALTLLLIAFAASLHRGRLLRGLGIGRTILASGTFGVLGLAAFTAAARADQIQRSPLASLAIALVGLVLLRLIAARIDPTTGAAG